MSRERRLPDGFAVRLRPEVVRRADGTLVGGSPMRVVRLRPAAVAMFDGDRLTVRDVGSDTLAARLLDANLADPDLSGVAPPASRDLTVVIPVRDRAAQLHRALAAVAPLPCLVVDDGSRDPAAVAAVAQRHGARLLRLHVNGGPAAARNAGLAAVDTPYVAFVDSDVQVDAEVLRQLGRHLADPAVALVGPLVRSRATSARPRWFERYDEVASSLALGRRPCSVGPGAAVGWLPSACLLGRVAALRDDAVGGFDAVMRVGEDVDLVWRLVAAGHVARYDPTCIASHDARPTVRGWLGRKLVYGTGGAALAQRHPDAVAPAVMPPVAAAGALAVLAARPWAPLPLAAAGLVLQRRLAGTLAGVPGHQTLAIRLTARTLAWSVRQESALLTRHAWPVGALLGLSSRAGRRVLAAALVAELVVQAYELQRLPRPTWVVARQFDNLAYGTGLWIGAWRERSVRCLLPRFVWRHRN